MSAMSDLVCITFPDARERRRVKGRPAPWTRACVIRATFGQLYGPGDVHPLAYAEDPYPIGTGTSWDRAWGDALEFTREWKVARNRMPHQAATQCAFASRMAVHTGRTTVAFRHADSVHVGFRFVPEPEYVISGIPTIPIARYVPGKPAEFFPLLVG
jgi:hypothetical protein